MLVEPAICYRYVSFPNSDRGPVCTKALSYMYALCHRDMAVDNVEDCSYDVAIEFILLEKCRNCFGSLTSFFKAVFIS